ncbi:MAG TPA: iron-containing redox enzyme family protein [Micromonosporaceae bacterium]|nr:iron-containing redox enzyme family protein [Micromonosporaceae bacterium]
MTLQAVVSLVVRDLSRAAARMWQAEPARERYRAWLEISHDLLRATAPLLAEAVAECVRRGEGRLAAYYAEQLQEEYGHEDWVAQDYAAAGGDPAHLGQRVPAPVAARLAGAQYYWLRHAHPVALAGHIAVLEWHPPRPNLVPTLVRRTGLPRTAFSTLERHIDLDAGHGRRLEQALSGMDLPVQWRRLLTTSALTSAYGLVDLMADIAQGTTENPQPAGGEP